MSTYAEHLGIDLDKLEAERHYHYKTPTPKYISDYIKPPAASEADWQTITRAANAVGYSVETLRRWITSGKIRHEKRGRRIYVYDPDVKRHAGKP